MGWTWLGFRVRHGTQDGFLKKIHFFCSRSYVKFSTKIVTFQWYELNLIFIYLFQRHIGHGANATHLVDP